MTKRSEAVGLPAPTEKISEASEGPDAESLLDTEEIYTRVVYKEVHADMNEWDEVKESEALPYLPTRKEEVNINVGIKEKTKIKVPLLGFIKLEDHFQYKKGYILNTGGNTWGLDFVPKVAGEESDRYVQYLAVSGYRGASEEHMGLDEIQPEGEYQNCIQLWKLRLSARQKQEDPVLALCILHDFGVVYDLKWCPYGTYEEVNLPLPLPFIYI
ncbi:hypothetical protein BY458DRAFT_443350 [Sporodiniella umbellata]|nr:hypothetical protein BY458DRAFT_443350 [Sporodiniella umbellata]